jgi:hypothetical protein
MWGSSHQFESPQQRLSTPASGFSPGGGKPPPRVRAVPRFGEIYPIWASEGGLEPGNAGNFPSLGKFPWTEHNGRCPQTPRISRSSRFLGSGGGRCPGRAAPWVLGRSRRSHSVRSAERLGREISADLAHAWLAERQVRSRAEQVDLRPSGSVARVNSVLTRGVQAGSGIPRGGFLFG